MAPAITSGQGRQEKTAFLMARARFWGGEIFLRRGEIFGCAGRMDLPWIWVYLVVSFIGMFGGIVPVCIRNPVLINHRGDFRRKKDTMPWDRWLVPTYGILSCYLTPAVIGLDVGRHGWSDLGPVTAILGIAGFLAGSALLTWAMLTNTHFETTVRIQTDRNHRVALYSRTQES
jgi:hypothetical protein